MTPHLIHLRPSLRPGARPISSPLLVLLELSRQTYSEKYRKIALLKPNQAKTVLKLAEAAGHIEVQFNSTKTVVQEYKFCRDSKEAVLEATATVFQGSNPTGCASILLSLLQRTVGIPERSDDLRATLLMSPSTEEDVDCAIKLADAFGLINVTHETDGGQTVVLNPYLFQDAPKGAESRSFRSALPIKPWPTKFLSTSVHRPECRYPRT